MHKDDSTTRLPSKAMVQMSRSTGARVWGLCGFPSLSVYQHNGEHGLRGHLPVTD